MVVIKLLLVVPPLMHLGKASMSLPSEKHQDCTVLVAGTSQPYLTPTNFRRRQPCWSCVSFQHYYGFERRGQWGEREMQRNFVQETNGAGTRLAGIGSFGFETNSGHYGMVNESTPRVANILKLKMSITTNKFIIKKYICVYLMILIWCHKYYITL